MKAVKLDLESVSQRLEDILFVQETVLLAPLDQVIGVKALPQITACITNPILVVGADFSNDQ